jgi:hypothetical protein
VQRDDGTLIDLKTILGEYKIEDVNVPAGDAIVYLVHPKIPYKADKDCKVQAQDDPTREQIAEYLYGCYGWLNGIVLLSDFANIRVDMPFKSAKHR